MSKLLRRCLSLALVFMLLASLSVGSTLNASADNKTGDGLAAYAMTAYNEGWRYVWGGASYGAVDCSGLIYSYVGGGARVTEDMLYSSPESGYVSDGVPDIPGLGLWQPGHVGVYVGGGMAVDARDEISNVCYQSVSTKSWVMWFKVAGVSYGTDSGTNAGVTNDNQSEKTSVRDSESDAPAQKPDDTLQLGSTGSDVNRLQERLKTLGYFSDNTTEYFGYVTKGALEDFQSQAGLSVTGVYDSETKSALEGANAPSKPVTVVENDVESDEPAVNNAEEEKADEPSEALEADEPENEPEEAVEETESSDAEFDEEYSYDSAENVVYDETEADDESEDESFEYDTPIFAEFEEYEPEEQTEEIVSSESEEAEAAPADAVYSLGDEADEISDIQYMLIKLGYFDYNITGVFCENTADAVYAFRSDYGLGDENYLDYESLQAVYGAYNGGDEMTASNEAMNTVVEAESDSASATSENETAADDTSDSVQVSVQNEQSVTFVADNSGSENTAADTADKSENSDTAVNATVTSQPVSDSDSAKGLTKQQVKTATADNAAAAVGTAKNSSGNESVVFIQTGAEDRSSVLLVFVVIGASFVIIFFVGTIHYWNVSMEKRRQRARRSATVSAYRRS